MQFSHIDFAAVAVGTFAALLFGLIWYAPPVFGRTWQKHTGLTDDRMKSRSVILTFGPAIVLTFVMGVALAALLPMQRLDWTQGAFAGLLIGAGIGAAALAGHYIFARRTIHLFLIDGGYTVVSMTILGAVIAAMS